VGRAFSDRPRKSVLRVPHKREGAAPWSNRMTSALRASAIIP
jgi:hypothetical protein